MHHIQDLGRSLVGPALLGALLSSCSLTGSVAPGNPPALVQAVAETRVTTDNAVDADDPELWADARDPSRALVFATDKTDGLYVHNLDGSVRQFLPDGPLNNVDLRTGFVVNDSPMVLVAASDRARFGIRTYLLDPQSLTTTPFGFIPIDLGEPYGMCVGRLDGQVYLFVNNKEGVIAQIRVDAGAEGAVGTVVRRLKVASQPEGCVVDDEAHALYVGEEDVAVWRFALDAAEPQPVAIARADGRRIVADIEGLAIMRDAGHKYLVVSSQGDNAYAIYRIENGEHVYVGRMAVEAGAVIDGVTGTDGLSAWSGPIGPYPRGLLAMHDEDDSPLRGQQNFKFVDWRDIRRIFSLP